MDHLGLERGIEQGLEQGVQREARSLILRLLTRRLEELPERFQLQIDALSTAQLESLGEALLDFREMTDLDRWLQENR